MWREVGADIVLFLRHWFAIAKNLLIFTAIAMGGATAVAWLVLTLRQLFRDIALRFDETNAAAGDTALMILLGFIAAVTLVAVLSDDDGGWR
jgi:hypothetical protein